MQILYKSEEMKVCLPIHFRDLLFITEIASIQVDLLLLTHNHEYWNAVSTVGRRLFVVANNFLIFRLGSAAFAEFSGRHFFSMGPIKIHNGGHYAHVQDSNAYNFC